MRKTNSGIGLVLALAVGVPVVTLVATWHQMGNFGGDSIIRGTEVKAPPPSARTAAAAQNQQGQPGVPASQATPAVGGDPATPPASGSQSAPRPQAAQPEPGRSALDFTAFKPSWQEPLQKADPKAGAQLASAGRPQGGVQACVACHGQQGVSPAGGNFPNLAGLKAEYLAKQLTDYHDGKRNHPLMSMIAKGLTPEEIGQLARYYASLPAPPVQAAAGPESARTLDALGDNGRALPACANCHGLQGRGEGPLLPRLAGQPKGYFIDQMNAFRGGQRANDDVGVMRAFAQRLTAQEIEALGEYYAGAARQQ
ncbi:c-type cytochrome [Bordetella genomosp. 13]|uniref:c-type cytochrome n=1 Tax=Bordetella genomosp. 13 TaxID=463040 RepID=UPI0011A58706|nr:c-type cytochrome [Bordetella genomosp. 13]